MIKNFKNSFNNLKNIRTITTCAVLMAFAVALSLITIYLGTLKISFYSIVTAMVGFIFGPFVSGIFGGLLDILQYIIKPTGSFQIGFTINSIISGIIYGMGLYKKPLSLKRVFIVRFINGIIVSVFLTTIWLCIYYGIGNLYKIPLTLLKELVLIIIHSVILYKILQILKIKSK